MNSSTGPDKLIVANCSGFFGDRFTAAKDRIYTSKQHRKTYSQNLEKCKRATPKLKSGVFVLALNRTLDC